MWGYNKRSNFHVIRIPEGEEKESRAEKVLKKMMAENFSVLARDINLKIPEAEHPKCDKPKPPPRHMVTVLLKTICKEENVNSSQRNDTLPMRGT